MRRIKRACYSSKQQETKRPREDEADAKSGGERMSDHPGSVERAGEVGAGGTRARLDGVSAGAGCCATKVFDSGGRLVSDRRERELKGSSKMRRRRG